MTRAEPAHDRQRRRIVLLAAQAFALGLTMAWILIPASAIFLATYGSRLLPVTYIGAGVAGVLSSKWLAAALRKRPLASVAAKILAATSAALLVSWALLSASNANWVSFALLLLVPIVVPVGFMLVVGQAGMLLDVRALKALYGRVVAGFALGFVAGGLAAPLLLSVFDRAEHLLAAAAIAAGLFLVLVEATRRSFPAELSVVEAGGQGGVDALLPTLRALTRNRYVMLIVGFQMLSAVESQWLDFLVFDRAATRYDGSGGLARFVGQFSAIAYGADIVFLLVLAGFLLRRFGLRFGLTANATGVLAMIVAMVVAASLRGSSATIVFVLIVAARVTDLVLSDGTSRTSLSAAYQVVPARHRLAAPAAVEGLAVPVAIGISGVVLLIVRSAGGIGGSVLPVLTGLVVVAWTVVAGLLYREYRINLLASLRSRTLDPVGLTIDDPNTLLVIDRLLESDDPRDVRLGLDILANARHAELPVRLGRLVSDRRENVRLDAFERLARLDVHAAAGVARRALDDSSPVMRAACIRVLGVAGEPADLGGIVAHSSDDAPEVKVAVAAALSRIGDGVMRAQVASEVSRLAHSDAPLDRVMACDMWRECDPGAWVDRAALLALLADPDHDVVNSALAAIRWPEDAAWLTGVARHLDNRRTAGAALDALVRGGDAVLGVVDRGLRSSEFSRRGQESLARACRMIGGAVAVDVLRRHLEHPDREVGLAVMTALAALHPSDPGPQIAPPRAEPGAPETAEAAVVRADLEHAAYVLRALVAFDDAPAAALLCAALRDEWELVRKRVLAGLSVRHGAEGASRIAFQFAQRDSRSHALALEWLDVTLTGTDRGAIAVLEPGLSDRDRMTALTRTISPARQSSHDVLLDLIEDRDGRWRRPWIQACALYAATGVPDVDLDLITVAGADEVGIVGEALAVLRSAR